VPTKARAKAKAGARTTGGKLRVEQVRSGIGHPAAHRRTLRAIGLKHHQDVVVVTDSPSLRGMLNQVRHLVEVTPAREG
jgi:large subunit ribosomal protein L30